MSLLEAGFNPKRDKLIVSVDDEMVEKIRAQSQADMDPVEIEQQRLLEEKKTMEGSNVGCDPAQAMVM